MILPTKHISQNMALLTIGAEILKRLDRPRTVSAIWEHIRESASETREDSFHLGYDWFVLSLDLLYAIDAVEFHQGLVKRRPGP